MHGTTSLAGEIKEPKRIYHEVYFWALIVTVIYILANLAYLALLPIWHPGASDIAGNGIMFASNDRGAAAAGMMGNSSVFIMAGLIMVSTLDVIVA
jgi:APA family basic amino acid/polyamine antiporter